MATPVELEVLSGANVGTVTLVTDVSTPQDSVLVCFHGTDFRLASDMTTPTPGTWTLIATGDQGENAAHIKVWVRPVLAAGAQSVTTNDPGGSTGSHQALYVYDGVDPTDFVDAAAGSQGAASTSHIAPSVTPAVAGDVLVCGAQAFNSGNYTAPGGMTENTETDGSFSTMTTASEVLAAAGATGTRTFTFDSSSNYATASVAIKALDDAITATLQATLPAAVAAFDAEVTVAAVLEVTLPALVAAFDAEVTASGVLASNLPAIVANFDAEVVSSGVIASTLPALVAAFVGELDSQSLIATPLPGYVLFGRAFIFPTGSTADGPCCDTVDVMI